MDVGIVAEADTGGADGFVVTEDGEDTVVDFDGVLTVVVFGGVV